MVKVNKLTVERLYSEFGENDNLILLNSNADLDREIAKKEVNRPSLAIAGFFDTFASKRIQVLGKTEHDYLKTKDKKYKKEVFEKIVTYDIPCFIISRSLPCPQELLESADHKRIPVFASPHPTGILVANLSYFLWDTMSKEKLIHGVLVDIYGVGTLILGKSGIGKSECALELVSRGHRLISDDQIYAKRLIGGELVGRSDTNIQNHMEIQGLGIVNIARLFGASAIKESKRIELIINLEEFDKSKEYDRTGLYEQIYDILDVKLPYVTIPVFPGKNIATLIEVAVLNQILKQKGYHSAKEFNRMLIEKMLKESNKNEE
ncbi:MAG: HPr(Ser) kinase/phosphatase [Candidatus Coatesbacteria bacterium 4484_99]|uniref:HPr kinase/phosphorylase n=1 Tax=Candidatus Coatesbacteria bacterium 4484_99 TaxID=1970774 RepID=A0A1W9S0Y3_9BACT|nr:MAG: HPr(Ser) kinase/phosphatase [Candidatus Coatesbacteria bacterium 4484_99]RLC42223.1 MAG: HPr(Ser) kinase/phosphatase [Candidatus Coatesbacteria bacterium]